MSNSEPKFLCLKNIFKEEISFTLRKTIAQKNGITTSQKCVACKLAIKAINSAAFQLNFQSVSPCPGLSFIFFPQYIRCILPS